MIYTRHACFSCLIFEPVCFQYSWNFMLFFGNYCLRRRPGRIIIFSGNGLVSSDPDIISSFWTQFCFI